MDTSLTNSRESLAEARRDTTDWANADLSQQIRSIELEGYALFPDLMPDGALEAIREELDTLPTTPADYSSQQRVHPNVHLSDCPASINLIANPRLLDFLGELFGDDVICTSCGYALSEPGHPGIAVHTDAQPYGSKIFGLASSSPVLVRVLYYLDHLTPECSPFKVIPRSHLSMHRHGNPYNRMLSHPDELMVTCSAGSAVMINQKIFHGNYPNHSNGRRRMLAIAYRPAWAGPVVDVEIDNDPEMVSRLPAHVQPLFRSLNTRSIDYDVPNRPDGMPRSAPGISPARWEI